MGNTVMERQRSHTLRVASRETPPHETVGTMAWRDFHCAIGIRNVYLIEIEKRRRRRKAVKRFVGWAIVYGAAFAFALAVFSRL